MPRTTAWLIAFLCFALGASLGAVLGTSFSADREQARLERLREENRLLRELNATLEAQAAEVQRVLREGD